MYNYKMSLSLFFVVVVVYFVGAPLLLTPLDVVADSGGGMEEDAFWFVCLVQLGSTFARSTLTLQILTKVFQELLLV